MLIFRVVMLIFLLLQCGSSHNNDGETEEEEEELPDFLRKECNEEETFSLSDIVNVIKFSGKAKCNDYRKTFQFNPDPNAKKGHDLFVWHISGDSYLRFDVSEFTTHPNGTIDKLVSRRGEITTTKMSFYPTTGILVRFIRYFGSSDTYSYSFGATISESDYEIRIDQIKDTEAHHSAHINVYTNDEITQSFDKFPVEETMLGSERVTIDVLRRSNQSHQIEIQLTAVKLNCTCGPVQNTFNSSLEPLFFESPEYPKLHCKFTSCQATFLLPVELRNKYKILVADILLDHGVIEIEVGPNGITTWNRRTTYFVYESPIVTLTYHAYELYREKLGDIYSIRLQLVERQEGCECPQQPDINLYFEIPAFCRTIDCLYLLPELDDNTAQYYLESNFLVEYIYTRYHLYGEEMQIYAREGSGTWSPRESGRNLIHFHRYDNARSPAIFNLTYTSRGVHISHAERCGCTNQTISLLSGQVMNFTSPDWPAHYCDNLVCVTTYIAPAEHHLEVKLETISLEPDNDRVAFFEGTNITSNHIEVVTGETTIADPIVSSGTVLATMFISNGAVAFDGFSGTIAAVMESSRSTHFDHHIYGWWWLLALFTLLSIGCTVLLVLRKRGGMLRSQTMRLMDL